MTKRRRTRSTHRARAVCVLLAAGLGLGACATRQEQPTTFAWEEPTVRAASETPLSAGALKQRRLELRRAQHDLRHYHQTLTGLRRRRDHGGYLLLASYMDAYLGMHLEPLLRSDWQSRHPELMALDGGLRLAQAELLIQMRAPGRAQDVIDDVRERYAGREQMIVELPSGSQGTLGTVVESLSDRKWWKR